MTALDADRLLSHTTWLRQLALELLGDPDRADDVVQDTWVTALDRPPAAATDAGIRAWLARVARNLAFMRTRADRRRRARELVAARPESEPSVATSVERVAAQRELVDAVLTLEPADREVIVLRYFEALPPRTIAERLSISANAVRSRLSRALAKLRARLGRGDRARALALCAMTPAGRRVAAATTILAGGLLVKGTTKLIAIAAILVLATAVVWSSIESPLTGDDEPEMTTVTAGMATAAAETPAATTVERRAVEQPSAPEPPRKVDGQLVVLARCLDSTGTPIAGAEVTAIQVRGRPSVTTDADGKATLVLDWPAPLTTGNHHWIEVEASGDGLTRVYRQESVDGPGTVQIGDMTLVPGGSIHGVVRDVDGTPAANAHLWVAAGVGPADAGVEARRRTSARGFLGVGNGVRLWDRTDQNGEYRFDGVPATSVSIVARKQGRYAAYSYAFDVRARETVRAPDLRFELPRDEHTIRGVVRLADGEPVSGARIDAFPNRGARNIDPETMTQSEADGSFELIVLGDRAMTLQVRQRSDHTRAVLQHDVAVGTQDLEIVFPRERRLELVARAPDGSIIPKPTFYFVGLDGHYVYPSSRKDDDGTWHVVAPTAAFRIDARAEGFLPTVGGPFEPDTAPDRIVIRLPRAGALRGRVVANGVPVAGASVHVHRASREDVLVKFAGELYSRFESIMRGGQAATGADGSFAAHVTEPGRYVVHAEAAGFARAESVVFELDRGQSADGIELELGRASTLEGRVLVADGVDPDGTLVAATRGDGHVEMQLVGADGRFRFDGIAPGEWQVARCEPDDQQWLRSARSWPEYEVDSLPVHVRVLPGERATYDVDLTAEKPAVLRGRLAIANAKVAGWSVRLWNGRGSTAITDAAGRFEVGVRAAGTAWLSLTSPARTGGELSFSRSVELEPGLNHWELRADTAAVELRGLEPSAAPDAEVPQPGYALVWESGWQFLFDPSDDGARVSLGLPTGHATVRKRPAEEYGPADRWPRIGEISIEAGARNHFEAR